MRNRLTNERNIFSLNTLRLSALLLFSLLLLTSMVFPQPSTTVAGSVPSGPATNDVVKLTLRDAINMALRYNLGQIEAHENVRAIRGQRLQALSFLLPQVSAGVTENVEQSTTAPLGIRSTLLPRVVGPFSFTTATASVNQSLFSFQSIQRFRAARNAEEAANLSYNDTLDVITLTVGSVYLQVIEAASRIEAAEAQVRNAQAIYDQAVEDLHAGTSPKIDVTRSAVQLHTEQYNLSIARNNFSIAKLNLSRAIGLPLGQQFELAESIPYSDLEPPTVDDALKKAYGSRSDFRGALASVQAAQKELSAARGERYLVVAVNGDYGVQGFTLGQSHRIFGFQAGVSVPIFTGERIKGDVTIAEAALHQRKSEAENLRGQIDYDVRTAYLNLEAAREQVRVAKENVDLANENLDRSKERFRAGVTDSVEVVQAQQSLAGANDQYIVSLYAHNLAKLELARAQGLARTNYNQYLGTK
jgi:outer membrane protein TolC